MVSRILAAAMLIALLSASAAAAETLFTDRTAFEAAVAGPFVTEPFDTDLASADLITFPSGVESTGTGGLGDAINEVTGGQWQGRVRNFTTGTSGYQVVTWTFPQPILALGVDFSSISSTRGVTLTGDWDGTGGEPIELFPQTGSTGFLGVIGTEAFSSVTLTALGTGDNDLFQADDLAFACVGCPVFSDGFEAGDLTRWSLAVGAAVPLPSPPGNVAIDFALDGR